MDAVGYLLILNQKPATPLMIIMATCAADPDLTARCTLIPRIYIAFINTASSRVMLIVVLSLLIDVHELGGHF